MKVGAWLLDFGGDRLAAVGLVDQMHLMADPQLHAVPATPAHCTHVLFMGERCVPVFDPQCWFASEVMQTSRASGRRCLGLYRYAVSSVADLQLGAIWLETPPQRIEVDDNTSAALPSVEAARWAPITAACFTHGRGRRVAVLDLARLFGAASASPEPGPLAH